MRASQFFISTLKEAPADADVVSQQLMLRAGMIKKLAAGIYTYMPLGLRSIRKIEAIIREEMNRAGAIELLMPVVQPAELWVQSGRWEKYGPELLRLKDRHQRDFVLQPTSEEVVTDIARQEIRSYRQLPLNFYHIQTKFRDERRPRFGVMRGREFTMKDAYSFDRDLDGAMRSYDAMFGAYQRIFARMGLSFRAVAADTGAIGGTRSHEFQVIADAGEDQIAWSPDSNFAANVELAEAMPLLESRGAPTEAMHKVATPGRARCSDVAAYLGVPIERTIKAVVITVEPSEARLPSEARSAKEGSAKEGPEIWMLLVRGDHDLNEIKAGKLPGLERGWRLASEAEIVAHFGCPPGYLGPVAPRNPVRVVADRTVDRMSDFICGANEADYHLAGVNWGRDLPEPHAVADIRNVVAGDPSPDGKGRLQIQRGIEVGHVFYLGTLYSDKLGATYLDEQGQTRPLEMGCYGIGVTRLLGAAIEQGHDERGIIWPDPIAPFEVVLCPVNYRQSTAVREQADHLYRQLCDAGIDTLLDDRGERPGAMFADAELIGIPHRVTIGERGLKSDQLEYASRRALAPSMIPVSDAVAFIRERISR
ncbi:MAG TPA: proline--tRNA ligase [Burkholderiaceae bacterium]|jgi:prolyl-tRNA synthetase|nr:proline--tRNA ligase [Burkholderiaceae bacterium]